MKIKKEVEMNLAEIIDWGWKNPLLSYGKLYKKDDKEFGDYVSFDHQTNEVRVCGKIDCDDLFTVTIEQEITEDTEFEKLLEIRGSGVLYPHYLEAINDQMDDFSKEFHAYIDGEFKLIWRDGKLVE